jgi:hypothetical protein
MSLSDSVSGFIIYIPDEAHHPLTDNKTMSLKNAHYIPSNLIIPSGTAIADYSSNHPGGSDTKILSPGSYTISDQKYFHL